MKVAILGSRGIPASYSGFETSIQETATRFVKAGIETIVYCRRHHYEQQLEQFDGVKLIYCWSIKNKYLDTITHTLVSFVDSFLRRDIDVIVMYGVGNSIFMWLCRMLGVPVIAVLDGADWERKKWGLLARWFLKVSRSIAVTYSDFYIVDSEILCDAYRKRFRKEPIHIAYGANALSEYSREPLQRFNLKRRGFIIFVGRFVKEKGVDFLLRNFTQVNTDIKLVVVGGTSDKGYERELRELGNNRVIFAGFLYGKEYESLLHDALFYVSCSFLEGTSPSLLSAMAINGFALVSDIDENKEVLKGTCATFRTGDSQDFIDKLTFYCGHQQLVESERTKTKAVVQRFYDWSSITKKYLTLFDRALQLY